MQGLRQFLAFAEAAKHGSFASAARELGCAPSTLAKSVARLERSLGVKLFYRTTRHVGLTRDGARLFDRCQRVLAEIQDLEADAAGTRSEPAGMLRIDMPVVYGRQAILPLLAQLARRYPALEFDARLSDQPVDLVRDGVDLAIRIGALRDSSLVARRFASQTLKLCASPAYLAQHGEPTSLRALRDHRAVLFRMPATGRDRPWQFARRGVAVSLMAKGRIHFNDGDAMVQAAIDGLGVAQVPDYMVAQALRDGSLVELLPTLRPPSMPISAVYPSQRLVALRVRVVLDALLEPALP